MTYLRITCTPAQLQFWILDTAFLRLLVKRTAALSTYSLRLSSNFEANDLTRHLTTLNDVRSFRSTNKRHGHIDKI